MGQKMLRWKIRTGSHDDAVMFTRYDGIKILVCPTPSVVLSSVASLGERSPSYESVDDFQSIPSRSTLCFSQPASLLSCL